MPFVDISTKSDYASIYYMTNTPLTTVSGFDPDKPSIILLHPFLLDSSWLNSQFEDARLYQHYNLIAFDRRSSGKSMCRPSGRHDSWVDAADLALCHHALHLPPCHILALECVAVHCALRFAILFPEKCLSLILCNIPSSTPAKWVSTLCREILQHWCFADDVAALEQAQVDATKLIMGNDPSVILQDELIAYWQMEVPPCRRHRLLETVNVLLNGSGFPDDQALEGITQPVLLIHGDKNETYPIKNAEILREKLVNARPVLYPIKGGGGALSLTPASSIVHQVTSKFLARQTRMRSDLKPPEVSKEERMRVALLKVASIMNDTTLAKRDPLSPISFSCLPQDVVRSQNDLLAQYKKGKDTAFSPLGPDGKPIRKYSERHREHWFYGGKDGLSVTERTLAKNDMDRDKPQSNIRGDTGDDLQGRKLITGNGGDKTTIRAVTNSKVV